MSFAREISMSPLIIVVCRYLQGVDSARTYEIQSDRVNERGREEGGQCWQERVSGSH